MFIWVTIGKEGLDENVYSACSGVCAAAHGGTEMKRFMKGGLLGLFFCMLFLGSITVHAIVQAQSYGRLINYVGIVRGATQRLVKLELEGRPDDDLVDYLDDILTELKEGEGEYGLPSLSDLDYQQNLSDLELLWQQMKEDIGGYRMGSVDRTQLLAASEEHFVKANETVFAADHYTAAQNNRLLIFCVVMLGVMLLTWAFIFWALSQKILRLEDWNKKLKDLAQRDPLTGTYQMEAFKEEAQRLLDGAEQRKYAVIYTDFADFKYINDVFGYTYGDSILSRYGEILREEVRQGELCGRVSADNFVLLLSYENKEEVAARQRKADRKIIEFMNNSYDRQTIPTCCGICCTEDVVEELKIDGFLDRANFARKNVKNGTHPNYVYYNDSIRQHLWEEKRIESQMRDALENQEFQVYYQPKVDLITGRIASSEALVRWCSESGTVIPPDQFIPVFEQKFMINRLDQYVFETVCRWLRHLLDEGMEALPVSVNVSRLQFYDVEFVGRYVEIRDKYSIPPDLLEIEFTESIVFDNSNLLLQTVSALKKAGFSCSIDDFGKGYSSLSLLKELPVDVLKIDRFFFAESDDRERDSAIVQGIVEMVHKFHIHTVAEGIEEEDQLEFLKQIGCDYVQGYVFYRPMPQKDYERLLKEKGYCG